MAAGVVPQSSCSFRPRRRRASAPPAPRAGCVALAEKAEVHGEGVGRLQHPPMCQGPGVQVVALVPVAGPVPPPSMVVTPDISASSICCGQMKWMCASMPPAVRICPRRRWPRCRADDDVDAGLDVRIAGLADGADAAVLDADVGLDDAPVIEDQRVGDDRVHASARGAGSGPCRRGSPCRRRT
jgi:hypothetical protein